MRASPRGLQEFEALLNPQDVRSKIGEVGAPAAPHDAKEEWRHDLAGPKDLDGALDRVGDVAGLEDGRRQLACGLHERGGTGRQ
jgi:hypothetical protein